MSPTEHLVSGKRLQRIEDEHTGLRISLKDP
jgi:hypothetical protein